MNLNLTFTAPVRFSIPERFALQKKKKKSTPSALQDGPSTQLLHKSFAVAGLFQQKCRGAGMGSIWESHLYPSPLRIPRALG